MVAIFQKDGTTVCMLGTRGYVFICILVCIHPTVPVVSMLVCKRNIVIASITQTVHMVPGVEVKKIPSVILQIMYLNQRQKMKVILLGDTNCRLICFVCIACVKNVAT